MLLSGLLVEETVKFGVDYNLTRGLLAHSTESINLPFLSIHIFASVSAPTWCGSGQKLQYIRSAFSTVLTTKVYL